MKGTKARQIIRDSALVDGDLPKPMVLAAAPKAQRLILIQNRLHEGDARLAAAIEIQRIFRGYCARCRLLNVVDPIVSHTALYSDSEHHLTRLDDVQTPSPTKSAQSKKSKRSGSASLRSKYSAYVKSMRNAGYYDNSPDIMSFEDFCARMIQVWWKSKGTKSVHSLKANSGAGKRSSSLQSSEAAAMIQKAWRRHIDIQVFRYYRDLINFKNRGDPAMMLRCINPMEAKMLDAAMGIHIKFRLAGDKFPPNIYYKIYTHRPVQDLCANSPKDYTRPDVKHKMAKDVHNRGNRIPKKDTIGWYQRVENNGWRLVSDRLLQHIMADPVTWETSQKKVDFHHNKIQRRKDIEKKKKAKKIDWMRKMYRDGMLQSKATDTDTVALIEGAAAGMVATVDAYGPEAVQDWEVDELLDWTTSLNFDDYWGGWKEMATSNSSEKSIADRINILTAGVQDPFELQVTQDSQHATSTRPSFNTPELAPST